MPQLTIVETSFSPAVPSLRCYEWALPWRLVLFIRSSNSILIDATNEAVMLQVMDGQGALGLKKTGRVIDPPRLV